MPWRLGSSRSPTVKTTDTFKLSCFPAWQMVICEMPPSGTTCELCPTRQFLAPTSSTEDSRAKILALRAAGKAWQESEAAFFSRCRDYVPSSAPHLSFLRMYLRSVPVAGNEWGKNWPTSGMIYDGMLFPLKRWAPTTAAKDGSYLLPTPTAKHYGSNKGGAAGRTGNARHSIHQMATLGLLPGHEKGPLNREYLELVMGYPLRWTEITAWATAWFRSKRAPLSKG